MSKNNKSLALLPNGFVDVMPPFAEAEARSVRLLMDQFSGYGYQLVKPPFLEFEDSLLAPGPGAQLSSETFRIMDPVSHRMLGVRSDITAQVARIVYSRMQNEPRPLRLMYANDVLRTRGSQMRTERQFTQVGCELIDYQDHVEADIEICVLSILGLHSVGVSNITVDLTIPGFVDLMLDMVDEEQREHVARAVSQRDVDALDRMEDVRPAKILAEAMRASGTAEDALAVLRSIDMPVGDLAEDLARLEAVCVGARRGFDDLGLDDVRLSIDILEQKGFEYHKHFAFTLYCDDVHGELGRGGCYDVLFGGDYFHIDPQDMHVAKGFTLYMDTVSKLSVPVCDKKIVFVSPKESWSVFCELQVQGFVVVRGTGDEEYTKLCTHIYRDGTVEVR